jgi:hypothetical protein
MIDRWRVSDEQALELVSYEGKLTTTGRPRFRLSAKQISTVSTLFEIDSALAAAGMDQAWLHRPSDQMPRSPLDLMRAGAMDEVLRSLTPRLSRRSRFQRVNVIDNYAVPPCKPPIETSHASPIEMSLRHTAAGPFEVTCDGAGDPDERSGTDPAACDDRSRR